MKVRYGHTWSLTVVLTLILLSPTADAQARQVRITGPGGERAFRSNSNQVQIWSCTGGKMKTCSVHQGAEGGGEMTPSGRRGKDGKVPDLRITYAKMLRDRLREGRPQKKH